MRGRRPHPIGRRDHRGDRLGRRVGHHRRVGARDPRVGGRPLRCHRRHQGALRPDRGPHHGRARAHFPGPDDRPGRGGQPSEDAQRDRPDDPAGRAHDRVPARGGRAAALRALRRPSERGPRRGLGRHPGVITGLPHPHHDRRPALGHRDRRDGPPGAAERAGHERSCRRSGRRRPDPAPRQDGHYHPRQPHGLPVHPGVGPHRAGSGRGGAAGLPGRRDGRGPVDSRSGQGPLRHPRARPGGEPRVHPLLGHDQDVWGQLRGPPNPQRGGRSRRALGGPDGRSPRPGWTRSSNRSPAPAPPPSSSPKAPKSWVSSS